MKQEVVVMKLVVPEGRYYGLETSSYTAKLPIDLNFVVEDKPILVSLETGFHLPVTSAADGYELVPVKSAFIKYAAQSDPYKEDSFSISRLKNGYRTLTTKEMVVPVLFDEKELVTFISQSRSLSDHFIDITENNEKANVIREKRSDEQMSKEVAVGAFDLTSVLTTVLGEERAKNIQDNGILAGIKEAVSKRLEGLDPRIGQAAIAVAATTIATNLAVQWFKWFKLSKRVAGQMEDNIRTFKRAGLKINAVESPKLATIKALMSHYGQDSSVANINHNGNFFLKDTFKVDEMLSGMKMVDQETVIRLFNQSVAKLVEKGYGSEVIHVLRASTPVRGAVEPVSFGELSALSAAFDFVDFDGIFPPMRLSLADLYAIVAAAEVA